MARSKHQRVAAQQRAAERSKIAFAADGFVNLTTRTGIGAGSVADQGHYASNLISRQPRQLEAMYRDSWIVGQVVDAVADDMTRAGVDYGSAIDPGVAEELAATTQRLELWQAMGNGLRWARLYGGAVGILLIDGQKLVEPLRLDTIGRDAFKGILVMDRWMVQPSILDLVTDLGPDLGKPRRYTINAGAPHFSGETVHYSRVIRFEGPELPYYQRRAEQGWGMSVVERLLDRLLAFDSTTVGAAQLVNKAHLRTLSIDGLTQVLAAGGPGFAALKKQVEAIRQFQSSEGLTLVDGKDKFETHSYTFTGLDDLLLQFAQQLSGASQIPLVRLFGQSPAGLNATGEGDLRFYYDGIAAQQKRVLYGPASRVLDILHRSVRGGGVPANFAFTFNPLWQLGEDAKAAIAKVITDSVVAAVNVGVIDTPTAMKELRQSADVTGIYSNISDAAISEAESEPPEPGELALSPDAAIAL